MKWRVKDYLGLILYLWPLWLIGAGLLIEFEKKGRIHSYDSTSTDALISLAANLIDQNGIWLDEKKARPIYDNLRSRSPQDVTVSLVRRIHDPNGRLQVLFVAVKLGIPGSEDAIARVLTTNGDKKMAEDFLNCLSSKLHDVAVAWAAARGYRISTGPGSHRAKWGLF
jgi:hypothetical protein